VHDDAALGLQDRTAAAQRCELRRPTGADASLRVQVVLDLWLAAWPTIFQPAIGILMAGAVSTCSAVMLYVLYALHMLIAALQLTCSSCMNPLGSVHTCHW